MCILSRKKCSSDNVESFCHIWKFLLCPHTDQGENCSVNFNANVQSFGQGLTNVLRLHGFVDFQAPNQRCQVLIPPFHCYIPSFHTIIPYSFFTYNETRNCQQLLILQLVNHKSGGILSWISRRFTNLLPLSQPHTWIKILRCTVIPHSCSSALVVYLEPLFDPLCQLW